MVEVCPPAFSPAWRRGQSAIKFSLVLQGEEQSHGRGLSSSLVSSLEERPASWRSLPLVEGGLVYDR
jgi:hypothetical protein